MELYEEINVLCAEIVNELMPVNTLITYTGGRINVSADDIDAGESVSDEYEMALSSTKVGDKREIQVVNWYSHSVCISGLVFVSYAEARRADRNTEILTFQAKLIDGVGERLLFRALGSRVLEVTFDGSGCEGDEDYYSRAFIKGINLKFYNEKETELVVMRDALVQAIKLLDKYETLSFLKNSYQNFGSLVKLDVSDYYKASVPNQLFDKLFEEE